MLIDSGSELSFITEELVNKLGLKRRSASIPLLGIGETHSGRTKGVVTARIYSIHDPAVCYTLQAYILPRLTFKIPSFTVSHDSWTHLQGLQLADPHFSHSKPVSLILGADSYGQIIKPDLIQGSLTLPVAQLTIFGWILFGPISDVLTDHEAMGYHCSVDQNLQELLIKFWHQEEIPKSDKEPLNHDDTKCEEHFRSTISRNRQGRYIVRLPLKLPATSLGDSAPTALRCLFRLGRRFKDNPAYSKLYTDFLQEYQYLGHMTPVLETEIEQFPAFYLPHHGVLREQSQSTKLRVVFNGSSRSNNGVSLNDILYSGAKLQNEIADVLLWFRLHQYVFSTDIVKMYRQIMVHPDDWNLQRIFWYDTNQQPRSYQLTTVTYGLNCAPFLALRVLQQLIEDEGNQFPLAVPSLHKGRYVDDIFGGSDSISEAKEIINQLKQLCLTGGFPLQKWNSNCSDLLAHLSVNPDHENQTVELESSRVKILGLHWHPKTDVFRFSALPSSNQIITKRTILSEIAQLFDPLGLISPVVIRAKILIQDLWLAKLEWDEPLSSDLQGRWEKFRRQLPALNNLHVPRWLHVTSSAVAVELHGFSDASQLAMSAAVYIRVRSDRDDVQVKLVCAKTKVAPLKRLTIPRLELTAALILARLISNTQRALNLMESSITLWTDSAVTLTWISSNPARWKDYVRNRVTVIQETVPSAIWRFVPGKENPADCATRGLTVNQLQQHPLWWTGPPWLQQSSAEWPKLTPSSPRVTDLEERSSLALAISSTSTVPVWDLLERYSSLSRLLRITVRCQRAGARFRRTIAEPPHNPITPGELQQSLHFWIRQIQRSHFRIEIKILTHGGHLSHSHPLTRLTPFIDEHGLLRVGGRLQYADLEPDLKHPFILPRHSHFTTLVIADAHIQTLHGGTQITLAYTRQTYWIIGGRAPVKSFILRCVRCARFRKRRAQQLMGQLPSARVTPSRPFLHTGVDYAGPITIKTWRGRAAKTYKGYLAIFVCFSTSAVHLEVVTEYTTEAFIAAYKRFTSRRGICATLYSDCGTNFVGADAELRRRFTSASKELKEMATLLASNGTEWRFNPPAAPHFGGKWEAAVKSTKFHLRRIVGDSLLTYEELSTLLTQIETILNSRPLCPLSEDGDDYSVLTPGHFLIGEALTTVPEPNLIEVPSSRLTRWQTIRQKTEQFWRRWKHEYLQRHQAISKWHHPSTEIKEGSLVLMTDERYPPTKWPLARVVQLHPGEDGLTRVVTLRTSAATFKRPVSRVCVLPLDPYTKTFGNSVTEGGRNVQEACNEDPKPRPAPSV